MFGISLTLLHRFSDGLLLYSMAGRDFEPIQLKLGVLGSRDVPCCSGENSIASLTGSDQGCRTSFERLLQPAPSAGAKPGSWVFSPPGERTASYSPGFSGLLRQTETGTVASGGRLLANSPSGRIGGRPPLSGSSGLPSGDVEAPCVFHHPWDSAAGTGSGPSGPSFTHQLPSTSRQF